MALRASRIAVAFVLGAGFATIALGCSVPFDPLARLAIVAWTGGTMLHAVRCLGARALVIRGDALDLRGNDGKWRRGELRDGSFVAPWLTIIRWQPADCRFQRTLAVLPDMLPQEAFRCLRVLLRWGRTPRSAGRDSRDTPKSQPCHDKPD